METQTAKSIASILPQTVATLVKSARGQTGEPSADAEKKRQRLDWLEKRMGMELHHPQLKEALTPLFSLVYRMCNPNMPAGILVMHGPNGCGKTKIARAIHGIFKSNRMNIGPVHRDATSEQEAECSIVNCEFVHWPTAVAEIKTSQWIVFENCMVEYFVILDDIGAEHDPSGIGLEKLYLILNRRERRHTLITTNFGPGEWESKFERRIASRLFRNATHIDLSEVPDYNSK